MIYKYTRNHLLEWFPKLPSYQAFSDRLNKLAPALQALAEHWLYIIEVNLHEHMECIVDSCPIILAKGPRSGHAKVAQELCEKSYNSSRKEWYYGLKLHAVVCRRSGRLPFPLSLMASGAAQHNLPATKQILENHLVLKHGKLYADKAYADAAWTEALKKDHALELHTPQKKRKSDAFMQAALINLGVIYLILIAMIALTLFLSAKMKSPYLVLTVIVPVLFIPMFLSPNGATGAYNLTLFLLPYNSTSLEIGKYVSYQFGNLVLDVHSVRAILYAALTVVMLPLAKLGFKKHQVSA